MSKDIEIELKFPLLNKDLVEGQLNAKATFIKESFQHDVYFNPPHKDFVKNMDNVCEWFRLRLSGDSVQMNYKDWQPHDAKLKTHCIEYEANADSYDQLSKILHALNFEKLIEVKKTRKVWNLGDVEVSVDSVEGLGEFIEVEYKGKREDIESVRSYLHEVISKIGAETSTLDVKGYPFLLLDLRTKS